MNHSLIVIQATIEDVSHIANLFNDYRIFYKQNSDVEGATRFLSDRLEKGESVIFIVQDTSSSSYVGFTQLYPSFSSVSMQRTLILNDLFVCHEYRGQGVAQLLLEAAQKYAEQENSKGLELSTAMDNLTAHKLYERFGFLRDTEYYHYFLKIDA